MAFDRLTDGLTGTDCEDELLPGTSLFHGQYRITKFINSGGFGITYLAKDSLDRDVVIKECFASAFCRRSRSRVRVRSLSHQGQLHKIIRGFLNEARSLAGLSHPNIVGVHQVFEDNDTAYMAMDYIRGYDLLEIIEEKKAHLTPDQIVALTAKLVSAIGYVHDNQLLHCDISPDNIFVNHAGEPVLIDFGAARRSATGEEQRYSGLSVVKDGYSPHELYTVGGNSGPWSDIYSLAASLRHAITGEAPADCQTRLAALVEKRPDPARPLAGRIEGYPPGFLETIDKAMSVRPGARFQSAQDWLKVLPQTKGFSDRHVVLLRRAPGQTTPAPQTTKPAVFRSSSADVVTRPLVPVQESSCGVDLSALAEINGFIGGWLVDGDTGQVIATEGKSSPAGLEAAIAPNLAVARASFRAIEALGDQDHIEDILFSLGKHLHLMRRLDRQPKYFLCVILDRNCANPGLARTLVRRVEQAIRM